MNLYKLVMDGSDNILLTPKVYLVPQVAITKPALHNVSV